MGKGNYAGQWPALDRGFYSPRENFQKNSGLKCNLVQSEVVSFLSPTYHQFFYLIIGLFFNLLGRGNFCWRGEISGCPYLFMKLC